LDAFARFAARFPNAHFTIAGDGPLREGLEKLCDETGLRDKVTFAGFLGGAELRELYHRAHLFIHPSRMTADQNQEGVPNSMLEAMATGLPVIATRHGGIPEAVRAGVSGFLVAERDRAALHEAMLKFTSDPCLWHDMSEVASSDVRNKFEALAQIAKLEAAYDEAISLKPHG
jgi:colanic acid/amylovoran biosynthesis glycosyltransferase